jgi:hypothetical protein
LPPPCFARQSAIHWRASATLGDTCSTHTHTQHTMRDAPHTQAGSVRGQGGVL